MEDYEIIEKINTALSTLFEIDKWLLTQDLSEQCITHRFALYLDKLFPKFNVDCEYNGDVKSPGGKKKIYLVKEHLREKGL